MSDRSNRQYKNVSATWWNNYFTPGGGWETNGGKNQTRVFAETFCQHVKFSDRSEFTLLDVGCALGDALIVFYGKYPKAILHGIDISEVGINRCKEQLGSIASFSVCTIDEINGHYQIIYISNVLEHFYDYAAKARILSAHCDRLCIMVPYKETKDGQSLVTDPDHPELHQQTFTKTSFDFLVEEERALSIKPYVVWAPRAWGLFSYRRRAFESFKNIFRRLSGRPLVEDRMQIIYDILVKPAERSGTNPSK
jgi:hypothetical protein